MKITRDEMIAVIAEAERQAHWAWWYGGGRDDINDHDRQDEMERRRRAAILDAIGAASIGPPWPCPKCGGGKPGSPGKDDLCQGCWDAEYRKS